jgi:hypothetical protein
MSGIPPIVPGTVARIYSDETIPNPYLQITFAKILDKDSAGQPRWKYCLCWRLEQLTRVFLVGLPSQIRSISSKVPQNIIATHCPSLVTAVALSPLHDALDKKHIEPGCIVKITKYSMANLKGHFIMLVGEVDLGSVIRMGGRIGDPTNIEAVAQKGGPSAGGAAPSMPVPAYSAPPPFSAPAQQPQPYSVPSYAPPQAPLQQTAYSSYAGARPAGMAAAELPPPPPVNNWPSNNNYTAGAGYSSTTYGNTNAIKSNNNYGPAGNKFAGQGQMGGKPQMTGDDAETIYTPICGLSPYQNTYACHLNYNPMTFSV